MMYAIAHVILGTILPWEDDNGDGRETMKLLDAEYFKLAPDPEEPDDTPPDADGFFEEVTLDDDESGWTKHYHGGSPIPSAYVGVELYEFDETNHFALSAITGAPTAEQTAEARAKYDALPDPVRAALPPFDIYILWSSS